MSLSVPVLLVWMLLGTVISILYWAHMSIGHFQRLAKKNEEAVTRLAAALVALTDLASAHNAAQTYTTTVPANPSYSPSEDSYESLEVTKADNAAEYEAVCKALFEQQQLFAEGDLITNGVKKDD